MAEHGSKKMSKGSMKAKPTEMKGKQPMAKAGTQAEAMSAAPNGGMMKGKNHK